MTNLPPRRRRFRFSLRTLLMATTLLSAVAGWIGWNWQIVRERRAVWAQLEARGEWSPFILSREEFLQFSQKLLPEEHATMAETTLPWMRRLMGDRAAGWVYAPHKSASEREAIERLFPEALPSDFLSRHLKDGMTLDGAQDFLDKLREFVVPSGNGVATYRIGPLELGLVWEWNSDPKYIRVLYLGRPPR